MVLVFKLFVIFIFLLEPVARVQQHAGQKPEIPIWQDRGYLEPVHHGSAQSAEWSQVIWNRVQGCKQKEPFCEKWRLSKACGQVSCNYCHTGGSEIQTSLDLEWLKWGWVVNGPDLEWNLKFGSPTIWNPGKWVPFCQKPFEIRTKMSKFWMVGTKYGRIFE